MKHPIRNLIIRGLGVIVAVGSLAYFIAVAWFPRVIDRWISGPPLWEGVAAVLVLGVTSGMVVSVHGVALPVSLLKYVFTPRVEVSYEQHESYVSVIVLAQNVSLAIGRAGCFIALFRILRGLAPGRILSTYLFSFAFTVIATYLYALLLSAFIFHPLLGLLRKRGIERET